MGRSLTIYGAAISGGKAGRGAANTAAHHKAKKIAKHSKKKKKGSGASSDFWAALKKAGL